MKKFTFILLYTYTLFHFISCSTNNNQSNTPNNEKTFKAISSNEIKIQSEIHITHFDSIIQISKKRFDWMNFIHIKDTLTNGSRFSNYETGFDSLYVKDVHVIVPGNYLIYLFHHFGGGSSEESGIIYHYKKKSDTLILKSSIWYEGHFKPEVIGNKIQIKALNFSNGKDGRCCPSKIELANLILRNDSIIYLGSSFIPLKN